MYKRLFDGPEAPDTPWLVSFLHYKRLPGYEKATHVDFMMNTMKVLADEFQGKIRFAFIIAS